jgi:hypothetical protein
MKTPYTLPAALCLLLLLTACGGGGGAAGITGNAGLGTTVTTGVSITPANAPGVAAAVMHGIAAVTGSSDGAASAPPLITGVAVNTSAGNFALAGLALDQLARVPGLQNTPGNNAIVGAAINQNVSCTNGGSATLFASIADPNFKVLNIADALSVSFFLCNESGVLLDGGLDLTVFDIFGGGPFDGTPPFTVTLDTVFNTLRALDGSLYYYANGDMRLVLDDDGAGNLNTVLSGAMLDTSYNNQHPLASAYHDQKLTGYLFDVSGDENTGDYVIDVDGTVESRDIDGTVSFTTTDTALDPAVAAFAGNEFVGNGDPTSGTLLATSSLDGSQLKLIARPNGVDVELQVDADGNGLFETTGIMTTWTALEAL